MQEQSIQSATSWHSHPKIYTLGDGQLSLLLTGPVTIEEKIDGSQFSFGVYAGELKVKSKEQNVDPTAPNGMFKLATETAVALAPNLTDGWMYRAEAVTKLKHNKLKYDRIPTGGFIVFDISPADGQYLCWEDKKAECDRLGIECVPLLFSGVNPDVHPLMGSTSILGGKIEGVVIKNYARQNRDGKCLMGKLVSQDFRESREIRIVRQVPEVIPEIISALKTIPRWEKAVQHLRDSGKLAHSASDIGPIVKEAQRDIADECRDQIANALLEWAMPQIQKGCVDGLALWYKDQLMQSQHENEE